MAARKNPSMPPRSTASRSSTRFYKPPQVKTLEGWRAEMPEGFEFTLKAWQFITHEAQQPDV